MDLPAQYSDYRSLGALSYAEREKAVALQSRFQVSGVKNTPAHKGLFIGNAGGNPRMKSLCECAHNLLWLKSRMI